jgi:hypothetical protein
MGRIDKYVAKARHDHPVRISEKRLKGPEKLIYAALIDAGGGPMAFGDMTAWIEHAERRTVHWREELEAIDPEKAEELLEGADLKETDILVIQSP